MGETFIGEISDLLVQPALKLLVRHDDCEPDQLLAEAREVAGDLATLTHSSKVGLLEISAYGISTLATLCAERGIDPSEVVAFGDMPNGLAMLACAGTAHAVQTKRQIVEAHPTDGFGYCLNCWATPGRAAGARCLTVRLLAGPTPATLSPARNG